MAANAIDLTTLDNVKQWLGLTSADDDALLQRMVTAVSAYIQTWLNRTIATSTYIETRDGNGRSRMMAADYPLKTVTAVSVNGQAIAPSPDIASVGFYFDRQVIGLRGALFLRGESNIGITYTAGFDATPPELEQACIETIALRYKEKDRIGFISKTLANETVTFSLADFSKSSQTILNNYKKVILL